MKKLLLIINPVTAKAIMTPHLIDILDIFEKGGYSVSVHISQHKGDVTEYIVDHGEKYDTVVCAGGDGTLSETINGVLSIEKRPAVGYIPSGTTNDFAKSWGIPTTPLEAARAIVSTEPKKTDISTFCSKPYVYVAAFGAFTEASYSTPQNMKKTLGWGAYILEGIKSLPTIKPINMKISFDGGEVEGDFLYGMISNTRHVGGFDLKLKEEISLSDGFMELILVRKPEKTADNVKLVSALLAQDTTSEYIIFKHTKNVRFTSVEDISWTVDGECGGAMKEGCAGILEGAIEMHF